MNLLEEQHRKLAQLIRNQYSAQHDVSSDESRKSTLQPAPENASSPEVTPSDNVATAAYKARQPPASNNIASARIGGHQRDSSPSLAREMASRRGIPLPSRSIQSAAAQARAQQISPDSSRKASGRNVSRIPLPIVDSQTDLQQAAAAKKAADDEGFTKFYSSLATGTLSKLSSVLAYAGLPLNVDEAPPEPPAHVQQSRRTARASHEPNVKKLFSQAALDAIEEEHRQRGTFGRGFAPAESFYVVQKGGGTYSYADIAKQHQQQLAGITQDDEEPEFVDAKEVQGQLSPNQGRFPQSQRGSFGNPRTNEELDLENATLKQTLQDLAGRLAAFEAHAQDASFAALTQSVASLRPQGTSDMATQERIRQLEKEVEAQAEERQKLEGLASKQEKTLKKYQTKFEEIRKSAREKDKAKKDKAAASGLSGAETVVAGTP